jgi:hypothetical protein
MSRLRELLDAISMLPDMEHRPLERQQLVDEIGCDVEWRRASRKRTMPRPHLLDEADYDEDEPQTYAEQRLDHKRYVATFDWFAWIDPIQTTPFDAMLRELYPPNAVAQMVTRPHPILSALGKSDGDGFECRLRLYANIVMPQWNGVFKVDV